MIQSHCLRMDSERRVDGRMIVNRSGGIAGRRPRGSRRKSSRWLVRARQAGRASFVAIVPASWSRIISCSWVTRAFAFAGGPLGISFTQYSTSGPARRVAEQGHFARSDARFPRATKGPRRRRVRANVRAAARPGTVIVFANDALASGFMQWLINARFRIPEDLSIVGFDGLPEDEPPWPARTSVAQTPAGDGQRRVSRLFVCIDVQLGRLQTIEFPMSHSPREHGGTTVWHVAGSAS